MVVLGGRLSNRPGPLDTWIFDLDSRFFPVRLQGRSDELISERPENHKDVELPHGWRGRSGPRGGPHAPMGAFGLHDRET